MFVKHVAKRKEIQYVLTIIIFVSRFCQRPIIPDKAKQTRKFLLKTIEISMGDRLIQLY